MLKVACIEVPALPLQLVLRQHPEWHSDPIVVLESDQPSATILWANRPAREQGVQKGLTLGQAKALTTKLHTKTVPDTEVQNAIDELFDVLLRYSPYVEPAPHVPGLFFLDPNGLGSLFGDFSAWGSSIFQTLQDLNWQARVVVGFARPFLYALCRATPSGVHISQDPSQERTLAAQVPLSHLNLPPSQQQQMERLGIHTIKDLLALPASGLRLRYGRELADMRAFLAGKRWTPLQPRQPSAPLSYCQELDPPAEDMTRLLFLLKAQLQRATHQLKERSEAITAFSLSLHPEYTVQLETGASASKTSTASTALADGWSTRIETATPSVDALMLTDLLRLRLANVALTAPIARTELHFEHLRVHPKQLLLPNARPLRDLDAANQALARLKAAFAPDAVMFAKLRAGHLPEGTFIFEACSEVHLPEPQTVQHLMPMVRRFYPPPKPLPRVPQSSPDSWLSNLRPLSGPYRISGGWWNKPTERDYYFAATTTGDTLWIFYDRPRNRWFVHGDLR